MIYRLAFVVMSLHLTAFAAQSGPWLREQGTAFTSVSLSASMDMDARSTGYFEFGITPTSTVGLDLGFSRNHSGAKLGYGTLFLRRALGRTDRVNKLAYEVGLGGTYGGPKRDMIPHIKTGLSWGRGIDYKGKGGWLTIDSAVLWNLDNYDHVSKVDTTLGLKFTELTTGILQLNLANQSDETFGFFEPSLVFSPRNYGVKVQIGLVTPLEQPENTSLKLGLWHEF
jgi:hypothetical protein